MRYFKDDVIYDECEIKKLVYPSTLPKIWGPENVASKGFLPVVEVTKPAITNLQLVSDDGVKLVDGIPTQTWLIQDKFETQEEIDAYLADIAEQEALATAQAEERALQLISDQAIAKLRELDTKSIRSLREYIISKGDAPQYLTDYEAEAVIEREKVKK